MPCLLASKATVFLSSFKELGDLSDEVGRQRQAYEGDTIDKVFFFKKQLDVHFTPPRHVHRLLEDTDLSKVLLTMGVGVGSSASLPLFGSHP